MLKYVNNFFKKLKVKKENLYFGYIFSKINQHTLPFKSMIEKCKDNNVSYSFFDLKTKEFLNKQEKPIQSIFEIVNNPFGIKPTLI